MPTKYREILGISGGCLAEFGRLNYIAGVVWKRPGVRSQALAIRAEGLIDQNPKRNRVAPNCTVPVK
jgi:hypothetical protein